MNHLCEPSEVVLLARSAEQGRQDLHAFTFHCFSSPLWVFEKPSVMTAGFPMRSSRLDFATQSKDMPQFYSAPSTAAVSHRPSHHRQLFLNCGFPEINRMSFLDTLLVLSLDHRIHMVLPPSAGRLHVPTRVGGPPRVGPFLLSGGDSSGQPDRAGIDSGFHRRRNYFQRVRLRFSG